MLTPLVDHGNKHRNEDRDEIDVPYPRRRIVPGGKYRGNHRAERVHRVAQAIRRRHRGITGAAGSPRCLAASVMPPRNPDAQHVHPSLMKIEQVRVEQRGEDILHHDQQSDPGDETLAAKQQQMHQPHRVQQDDPDHTPLHRDIQRLVVWIANDLAGGESE